MRIGWQSMSSTEHAVGYWPSLRQQLEAAGNPDTEVSVYGTRVGIIDQHRFFEFLDTTSVLANALKAEKEGFDAFVIGNFLDPGLREIRGMVDIPVLALGETCMYAACLMGGKFSLILVNQFFGPRIHENVQRYGLEKRLAGFGQIPFDPHQIDRAFREEAEKDRLIAEFTATARDTIAAGAEVVIPAGGRLISFLDWAGLRSIDGVPILNGITVTLKMAEAAVQIRRLTGVFTSRHGLYALPPADLVEKARDAYRTTYNIPDL